MSDLEIYTKALEKAKTNGFNDTGKTGQILQSMMLFETEQGKNQAINIIFSHEFAKAFWGREILQFYVKDASAVIRKEHPEWDEFGTTEVLQAWEFHLQEMVLEDDPVQYLANFL